MIIDANMYWLPQKIFTDKEIQNEFLRSAPRKFGTKMYMETSENHIEGAGKIVVERPVGYPGLNYDSTDYRIDKQLNDLKEQRIDAGILKLPGCQEWLSLELCRLFNDEMAKHIAESQGHLKGLAVVPPYADEETLYELERAITDLGLSGIQLSAHYGNYYLDDEQFRPFFQKINELKVPVYVHHTPVPVDYQSIYQYDNLRRTLGRNIDQVTAVGREIFSGMFEELPNLKLIHSMMGGGIHTYMNALFPEDSGNGRFDDRSKLFKKYFQENIFFEMSHAQPWGKIQLETAVKLIGSDKIIYGSSYPVKNSWFTEGSAFVQELAIAEKEKNELLFKTADTLYNLNLYESY
ncbi:amidohydrolase family protein [Enterococcus larvae]|uniref:amidohydrolase family protein n=1 Tax=Enterococcus larvae TaxID=2794352 RepID=UPI003F3ECBB4